MQFAQRGAVPPCDVQSCGGASGRPISETQGRSRRTLSYGYDAESLRISLDISSSDAGVAPWHTGYTYDNAGRLKTVLDDRLPAAAPFTYAYAPNSSLVASISTPAGLKTTKTYDTQGRLLSTTTVDAQLSPLSSFAYTYDAAGQRG
jgi:YD repeat-containing protein